MLNSLLSSLVTGRSRKLAVTALAAVCALTGVLALASSPASAFFKHEYVSQITGTPGGAFKGPCGLTIDPASQDLYVADFGDNAIDIFGSTDAYKSQISGTSVPGGTFEPGFVPRCSTAVSDVTGDVYVTDNDPAVVYVFSASGGYLETIEGTPSGHFEDTEGGRALRVAVDEVSGDVYVTDPVDGVVDRFNSKNEYQTQSDILAGAGGLEDAIAVDSHGDLYASDADGIQEFNPLGAEIGHIPVSTNSLAVDSEGNVYVTLNGGVEEFSPSGALNGGISSTSSRSLASAEGVVVNAAGNVYVAASGVVDIFGSNVLVPDVSTEGPSNVTGRTATLNGTVNPDGTQITSCEFEYGPTSAYGHTVPCKQAPVGSSPVAVSATLTGLQAGTEYHYRLVAANANGYNASEDKSFFTLGARIQEESFSNVGLHKVTLEAKINPEGVSTSYQIEYGTSEAYGSITPSTSIGAISEVVDVSVEPDTILQPETTYHFRVVATNADGTAYGPDVSSTTQSGFIGLPDGRGYELVSPVANADGNVYVPENGSAESGGDALTGSQQASADGDAVEYIAAPLAAGGTGNPNDYVATRDSGGGWSPSPVDLSTPGLDKAPFEAWFSNELLNSGTSAVPAGTDRLFEAREALLEGNGTLETELKQEVKREYKEKNQLEEEIAKLGEEGRTEGVEITSKNEEANRLPQEYLYESIGGRPDLVEVLPDGTLASDATFGNIGADLSHVISADGSRVFWSVREVIGHGDGGGPIYGPKALYVREDANTAEARTVLIANGGQFWTASPDGRYAFYTEGEKLLRFDVEDGTREELAGAGAGALGVIGVNETGEDGAYVYFVANGVLGDGGEHGATTGNCKLINSHYEGEANCNLYLRRGGVTTFIAALGPNDIVQQGEFNVEGALAASLGERTAEVTPDGHSLVFLSAASLTGYDNHYTEITDSGLFPTELSEVYVYDADTGGLSCASCNPTGAPPPSGASQSAPLPPSFNGLFMHHWTSENGARVFFDSTEALVAQDTNGVRDVYEWERDGSGSCGNVKGCVYLLSGGSSPYPSYLLDASTSGNDVFMVTRAELTPQDQGETYEVYDARVGATQPLAEPACTGTGCQGLPSVPPPFATPSSVTFDGVGNFPPPPPAVVAKPTKKTVKCAKGKTLKHGKCTRVKAKKEKSKAKKSAHTNRGATR